MPNATAIDRKTLINAHRDAPEGMMFYASIGELRKDNSLAPYWLAVNRAWRALSLNGVLCVEGVPTLYLSVRNKRVSAEEAAKLHCSFWNHGLATVFVLVDTTQVRIFSATAKPEQTKSNDGQLAGLVETMDSTRYALQLHSFLLQLGTGAYYRSHGQKFDPDSAVDAFLINNLRTLRNELIDPKCGLPVETAHVFLARLLFVAYLTDRGIINLPELAGLNTLYGPNLGKMLSRLKTVTKKREALLRIFQTLRDQFNGNMFEATTLAECRRLNEDALRHISDFFNGHDLGSGQYTLDFWAYDFSMIPVEIISAVYEDFLKTEDQPGKRGQGAYYTPRFLAETVIDLAVRDCDSLQGKCFLDPSCGSGIFLVTLFNRLAGTWMIEHPKAGYDQKANALKAIFRDQLRGVDVNPTACRIACFSLYLAFLDCFDPPDINQYIARKGKLPNILRFHPGQNKSDPEIPVIHEDDFLNPAGKLPGAMDFMVGNPPWANRGPEKGLHHQFARRIPTHLKTDGVASVLLPSKTFLNEKTNVFQLEWLQEIRLEEVVQLADYSKILFAEAKCPCMIVRFRNDPMVDSHDRVEYVAPKLTCASAREGLITVAPTDRKSISLQRLLHAAKHKTAPTVWKKHLWGSPRDIKFLDMLETFPKVGEICDLESDLNRRQKKRSKPFKAGQGFKPRKIDAKESDRKLPSLEEWDLNSHFVTPRCLENQPYFPSHFSNTLQKHLYAKKYRLDVMYSKPSDSLFEAPLLLVNQGFSSITFFDYDVYFQHSLQAIHAEKQDEHLLILLTVILRSKLAKYFLFHTSANWGTERDKVHLFELMRLPFPVPGDESLHPNSKKIAEKICTIFQNIIKHIKQHSETNKILLTENKHIAALEEKLEDLVYKYYDLTDQEIALIEDTVSVSIPSATPNNLHSFIPAQEPVHRNRVGMYHRGLVPYAETLQNTLNTWAEAANSKVRVSISGGVHDATEMACVTLSLKDKAAPFEVQVLSDDIVRKITDLAATASTTVGRLDYLRGLILFDGPQIYLFKPVALVNWTRTAALNDAAEIYAHIAQARQTSGDAH